MATVRDAVAEDARAISEVQVLGWQHAYRGILPDEFLAELSVERREIWWQHQIQAGALSVAVVEDDDGEVVGFASSGRGDHPHEAELYAIYLDPGRIGKGFGRSLMEAAVSTMRAQKYQQAILWVFADNAPARRFYEQAGWSVDGTFKVEEIGGAQPTQIRYRRALE
ncbi:MAG TPA: GNAT family N-acetyltransferase [Acidimicrobiia bacterium]|nr:GNAT family N-acetyltransferase [Acidimicrobiia bacterium]